MQQGEITLSGKGKYGSERFHGGKGLVEKVDYCDTKIEEVNHKLKKRKAFTELPLLKG